MLALLFPLSLQYGFGWPLQVVFAAWSVPFRYEVRAKQSSVAGAWTALGWLQNVDRAPWQGLAEIDLAENRTSFPTEVGCYQH